MEGKVSVIIPFYSRVEWLIEALDSVVNQTYKNYEIILVNDGSSVDLSQIITKYAGLRYFEKENGGPASARNLGIENALGEYIAFLDSDDLWMPEKLESQVILMAKTGLKWSHASYSTFIDTDINKLTLKDLSFFEGRIFPKCILSNPIATPTVIIRTDFLNSDKELRFDTDLRYGEDSYLWMRIAITNPIGVLPQSLALVRIRGQNAALNVRIQLSVRAQFWEIFEKNKQMYYGASKVNRYIKYIYRFCYLVNKVVISFEKRNLSKRSIENLSRTLYFIPYLFFKVYYRFLRNK